MFVDGDITLSLSLNNETFKIKKKKKKIHPRNIELFLTTVDVDTVWDSGNVYILFCCSKRKKKKKENVKKKAYKKETRDGWNDFR